mgnify:CR=1 FL=1
MLIFSFSLAYSQNTYKLSLTKKEIKEIKESPKRHFIIKRFKLYKQLTKKVQDYPTLKKLSHVNAFFNKILPQHDTAKYGIDDYWTTQKEFLIKGKGDCEDYVIAKYFTLLELGIPKDKLFLSVVRVKGRQTDHMVLLYFEDKKSIPLVMDNLSFKVIPITKRKKLIQKFAFNELGAYILKRNHLQKKVRINWGEVDKWDLILNRVYKYKQ